MKKAKITGDIVPVDCTKCGSNVWSFFRSYTTSAQASVPFKGSVVRPDVPMALMTCTKCKSILGFAVYFKLNFANGAMMFSTLWEPMALAPPSVKKRGRELR